jgi:hypothetical protein
VVEDGVLSNVVSKGNLLEAELFALIEKNLAGQAQQEQQGGAGAGASG